MSGSDRRTMRKVRARHRRGREGPAGLGRVALLCLLLAAAPWAPPEAAAQSSAPAEAPDVEMLWELMILTRGPDGVQVAHLMHVHNFGPSVATAVPLAVAEGARWLETPAGLILEQEVAIDPEPLPVGQQRRYMLVYEIPWQRLPMAIRRPILYPTHEMDLWVRAGELELRGVNLRAGGRELFEGVEVDTYSMTGLSPHPAWQVVLDSARSGASGLLAQAPLGQRSDPVDILRTHPAPRWLLGAVLLLGLAAAVRRVLPDRPAKGAVDEAAAAGGSASMEPAVGTDPLAARSRAASEIEMLKEEIVRVDVAFDNGELDEDTYKHRRGELKERLLSLMAAQRRRTSGGERR